MKKLLTIILLSIIFISCKDNDKICKYRIGTLNEIKTETYWDMELCKKETSITIIPHKEIYIEDLNCLYRVHDTIKDGKVILEKYE